MSTENVSEARLRAQRREAERQRAREERKKESAASRAARSNSGDANEDDPDDPLSAERKAWRERKRAEAAASGGAELTQNTTQEDQMILHAQKLQSENQSSLKNSIRVARETTQVGAHTIQKLDEQGEQFARMENTLDETNDSLSRSERILRGMKSIGGALTNLFTSDKTKKKGEKSSDKDKGPHTAGNSNGLNDLEEKDRARLTQHEVDTNMRKHGMASSPTSAASASSSSSSSSSSATRRGPTSTSTSVVPANAKQQAAIQQMEANMREEDEQLDELSDVLSTLKEQSNVINRQLVEQDQVIGRIDDKVTSTTERLKKGSRTMQKIS